VLGLIRCAHSEQIRTGAKWSTTSPPFMLTRSRLKHIKFFTLMRLFGRRNPPTSTPPYLHTPTPPPARNQPGAASTNGGR
jgi:hypothetical protein